jgi:hypothetical protein
MSAASSSRRRRSGKLFAGRGWHCLRESTPTQGDDFSRECHGETLTKETVAAPIEDEALYVQNTPRPCSNLRQISHLPREGLKTKGGRRAPTTKAQPKPAAKALGPATRTRSRKERESDQPPENMHINPVAGIGRVATDEMNTETISQSPRRLVAEDRRSATPSSGCSESGRPYRSCSARKLDNPTICEDLEQDRSKRSCTHRRSCSDASSCTGSGTSASEQSRSRRRKNTAGNASDTHMKNTDPMKESENRTSRIAQSAAITSDADAVERPCTPVAALATAERTPPGAPLRRSSRKRTNVPPELAESNRFRLGEERPCTVSRRAGEIPESVIEECADRMLLRRGHCAVCGQFRPLRPSAAVCFNLQCKILYDSR